MNTIKKSTNEWYTPKWLIEALGKFDLDPCAAVIPLWKTAETQYDKNDDGLSKKWFGRVWLNPPYSMPLLEQFVYKMAKHNNGIALLFNKTDSKMFQDIVFKEATAMLFLRDRIRFYREEGILGNRPVHGSVLIAFGKENAEVLRVCKITGTLTGKFVWL